MGFIEAGLGRQVSERDFLVTLKQLPTQSDAHPDTVNGTLIHTMGTSYTQWDPHIQNGILIHTIGSSQTQWNPRTQWDPHTHKGNLIYTQ